jgi:hypothetical protein
VREVLFYGAVLIGLLVFVPLVMMAWTVVVEAVLDWLDRDNPGDPR